MAPGHGIIDIIRMSFEGNWLNMLGIRTEYHGHSTGVHAVEMIHGGSRGGLLGGLLTTDRAGFDFGCESNTPLVGLTLEVDGSPTVTDCPRLANLTGNTGRAKWLVPPGFAGFVSNVSLSEYGNGSIREFAKDLNGAAKVRNSKFCGMNCVAYPDVPEGRNSDDGRNNR